MAGGRLRLTADAKVQKDENMLLEIHLRPIKVTADLPEWGRSGMEMVGAMLRGHVDSASSPPQRVFAEK